MRWFLAVLLLPSLAFGAVHPTAPHWYSGIETIAFQNGVEPDVSYAGNVLTYIDESAATTNYSTIDSVRIGTPATGTDRMRILWQVDLSAIPADAVIVDAYLELCRSSASATYTSSLNDNLGFYRIFRNWTESQTTWVVRETTSPDDSTWSTAGLQDISGTLPSDAYGLGATKIVRSGWDMGVAGITGRNVGDYVLAVGTDSVYSGYGLSAVMDRNDLPDAVGPIKPIPPGAGMPKTLTHYDVSRLVRNWHAKVWGNKGAMLRILGDESATTNAGHYVAYRSDNDATASYRPKLIVRYLLATATSSGQGGSGGTTLGADN